MLRHVRLQFSLFRYDDEILKLLKPPDEVTENLDIIKVGL